MNSTTQASEAALATLADASALDLPPPRSPLRIFFARLVREKPVGAAAALLFLIFVLSGIFAADRKSVV